MIVGEFEGVGEAEGVEAFGGGGTCDAIGEVGDVVASSEPACTCPLKLLRGVGHRLHAVVEERVVLGL